MTDFLDSLARLRNPINLLDIALVALIFYALLRLFRGTQAVQLLRGILVIALVAVAVINSDFIDLTAFSWLIRNSTGVVLVAIPVIFQPELRRALERVGRSAPVLTWRSSDAPTQRVVSNVVRAVEQLAQQRHGALIVFEGATGLADYATSGTRLDAEITSELLTTIFFPKTSLHDGAVIISGYRVVAAGCVLPLTARSLGDTQLGTRHRAGIGLSEQSDALVIIVSEETGTTSVARNGRILRLEPNRLRTLLSEFYRP